MVIDHGVCERLAGTWRVVSTFRESRGGALVEVALLAAYVAVAAAVGTLPNLVTSTWISEPGYGCS